MLEFENNLSLIFSIRIHPVSEYRPSIKRGFLSLFMKINFAANQFLCLIFIQSPPTALPYIVLQLYKMIQRFNQVYIHSFPSFVENQMTIQSSSFFAVQKQKALSHHNRQGREIFFTSLYGKRQYSIFLSQSVCWLQITPIPDKVKAYFDAENKERLESGGDL
jgi:hypothetical protein